jgi:methyl-accepting chemotaxis protein
LNKNTNVEEIVKALTTPIDQNKREFSSFLEMQKFLLKVPIELIDEIVDDNKKGFKSMHGKLLDTHSAFDLKINEVNEKTILKVEDKVRGINKILSQIDTKTSESLESLNTQIDEIYEHIKQELLEGDNVKKMEQKIKQAYDEALKVSNLLEDKLKEFEDRI